MENKMRGSAKILGILLCNIYLTTSVKGGFFKSQNREENLTISLFLFSSPSYPQVITLFFLK